MPARDKSSDTNKLPDIQGAVQRPSKSSRDSKRVDEVDVSTESSAGEEDPDAGLDDPATRDAIQGEAQAHARRQQRR